MITSLNDWVMFLRSADSALGIPMVVCGLGLMLFGWRMWKLCVMLSFGILGAVLGTIVAGEGDGQVLLAIAGALLLGLVSFYPARFAIVLLGGLIGVGVAHVYVSKFKLTDLMYWSILGTAFVACTGFSIISRQRVVIFVTAFLGAVLLMSGLATWAMSVPAFFGTMRALANYSFLVVPFLLLVPTSMSCFYQISEVRRLQVEL